MNSTAANHHCEAGTDPSSSEWGLVQCSSILITTSSISAHTYIKHVCYLVLLIGMLMQAGCRAPAHPEGVHNTSQMHPVGKSSPAKWLLLWALLCGTLARLCFFCWALNRKEKGLIISSSTLVATWSSDPFLSLSICSVCFARGWGKAVQWAQAVAVHSAEGMCWGWGAAMEAMGSRWDLQNQLQPFPWAHRSVLLFQTLSLFHFPSRYVLCGAVQREQKAQKWWRDLLCIAAA